MSETVDVPRELLETCRMIAVSLSCRVDDGEIAKEADEVAERLDALLSSPPAPATETPTPRTDAEHRRLLEQKIEGSLEYDFRDFARQLERELASSNGSTVRLSEELIESKKEARRWRQKFLTQRDEADGNTWIWQGDDHDTPESLVCPVIVQPDQIRERVRAERELADARAAIAWRPIEIAPRDGTKILLFGPLIGICIGHHDWQLGRFPDHWRVGDARLEMDDFTHWKPLPAGPDGGEG